MTDKQKQKFISRVSKKYNLVYLKETGGMPVFKASVYFESLGDAPAWEIYFPYDSDDNTIAWAMQALTFRAGYEYCIKKISKP